MRPLRGAFFYGVAMRFHRLSAAFYSKYGQFDEILNKESRPYYVLLMELDGLTYAIPLRSNITHRFCFIADSSNGYNCGLDYSKAVVITDMAEFIDSAHITIRRHEYNVFKQHEFLIKKQFYSFVVSYKKEVRRRQKNPVLPMSSLCRYASLKYFHRELGL
jgi:protein AbiQ